MRVLLVIFALLLLPVLALFHRLHFTRAMQPQLLVRVMNALDEPELAHVRTDPGTRMNYLDVILGGAVPDIVWRQRAFDRVRTIPGVRCREEDNHIRVPASITGKLEGETLHLSGWLRDDATLRDVELWLSEGRPGLKVETSGVRVSPYVSAEESPRRVRSPLFQPLWSLIEVPAVLDITKNGHDIQMTGALPSGEIKKKVVAAVIGDRVDTTLEVHDLRLGAYVKSAGFTVKADELAAFLKVLFESQITTRFHADADSIAFAAEVTDEQQGKWLPLLAALGSGKTLDAQWKIQPSVYHLKTYMPVSKLPPELMDKLKAALSDAVLAFSPTSSEVTTEQMPILNTCTQVIRAALEANPELRIAVGAHPEAGGESKGSKLLAQRRAEAVVGQFVDRQVPAKVFEVVPFAAPHAGDTEAAARSHKVEMFVK